jgi:membrane AbrB-like protein
MAPSAPRSRVSAIRSVLARAPALAALVACTAGGAICAALQTPLPWMIGALVTMAALQMFGLRLAAPRFGRHTGQLLIATALGLYFTPAVARQVLAHWQLLLVAAFFAVGLAYVGAWMLSRWTDTDRTTALFASVPGGAAEMTNLGERFGARPDRIAVAQSLRILLVVVIVPVAMTWSGAHGSDLDATSTIPFDVRGLVALLGCALTAGLALWFVGSPNPFMLGPLAVAIALTVTDIHWSSVPAVLINAGQVLVGCSLGSRFEPSFIRSAPRYLFVVGVTTLVGIAISALFGAMLAYWGALPVATMILATAPGGIAEMCITAQVLQLGVPVVTAAHVARLIILVTTTAPIFRLMRGLTKRR